MDRSLAHRILLVVPALNGPPAKHPTRIQESVTIHFYCIKRLTGSLGDLISHFQEERYSKGTLPFISTLQAYSRVLQLGRATFSCPNLILAQSILAFEFSSTNYRLRQFWGKEICSQIYLSDHGSIKWLFRYVTVIKNDFKVHRYDITVKMNFIAGHDITAVILSVIFKITVVIRP